MSTIFYFQTWFRDVLADIFYLSRQRPHLVYWKSLDSWKIFSRRDKWYEMRLSRSKRDECF